MYAHHPMSFNLFSLLPVSIHSLTSSIDKLWFSILKKCRYIQLTQMKNWQIQRKSFKAKMFLDFLAKFIIFNDVEFFDFLTLLSLRSRAENSIKKSVKKSPTKLQKQQFVECESRRVWFLIKKSPNNGINFPQTQRVNIERNWFFWPQQIFPHKKFHPFFLWLQCFTQIRLKTNNL